MNTTIQPILYPFRKTAQRSYQWLTNAQAIQTYRFVWAMIQLVCWLAAWAITSTIKLGKSARRYYEAEWSRDLTGFTNWLENKLDRCLADNPRPTIAVPIIMASDAETDTNDDPTNSDAEGTDGEQLESYRFLIPHSLAQRLAAHNDTQAWRDLGPEDEARYLTIVEDFVLTHTDMPKDCWSIPETREDSMGGIVPNTPYQADYRYPRWTHNEELIAIDLTLAIADTDNEPDSHIRHTNAALQHWIRSNHDIRLIQGCIDDKYWIEENTNFPEGQGNLFLMTAATEGSRSLAQCIGGLDRVHGSQNQWEASINIPYDEETDSDSVVVFTGDRTQAIQALWQNRHNAYENQ